MRIKENRERIRKSNLKQEMASSMKKERQEFKQEAALTLILLRLKTKVLPQLNPIHIEVKLVVDSQQFCLKISLIPLCLRLLL
jgi:hypothetical protein